MILRWMFWILGWAAAANLDAQCISGDCVQGVGTMLWEGEISQYTGSWRNGKMHGTGTMNYADGSVFKGSWINGRLHGKGSMAFAARTEMAAVFAIPLKVSGTMIRFIQTGLPKANNRHPCL